MGALRAVGSTDFYRTYPLKTFYQLSSELELLARLWNCMQWQYLTQGWGA